MNNAHRTLVGLGIVGLALAGCRSETNEGPDDDTAASDDDTSDDDTGASDDDSMDDDAADDDTSDAPVVRMMLHGGGAEDDELYGRFVAAAGYGHLVTLGAVEEPEQYPDLLFWDGYFVELGATSAETINTESAADAAAQGVADALAAADGIYIRGGDQSRYLEQWTGTPLHDGLLDAWDRGAVIGGSSAGCAILGERIYDARIGGVAAWEALLDPFDPTITFTDGFLPALPQVITDTHFTERGRIGRLAVFLERWKGEGAPAPLGIGVDPMTALFVNSDGTAEVAGAGSVTVIEPSGATSSLAAGRPPDIRGQRLWQLPAGYSVDLAAFAGDPVVERPPYVSPWGGTSGWPGDLAATSLDGDRYAHRSLGDWEISGLEPDPDAWRDGQLTLVAGDGSLPGLLVVTALYEASDYYENHLGGMFWALAQQPQTVAVGLDIDLSADAAPPATLTAGPASYLLVLDARAATHAGIPTDGGWQTAAIEGASLCVVGPEESWSGLD